MSRHYFRSPRAADRIEAARSFLGALKGGEPFLVVAPSRHPADRLTQEFTRGRGSSAASFGAYRFGFLLLADRLAGPELSGRGLRRLTPATRLAAVVRVLHRAGKEGSLGRFAKVADGPGLATRLAHTFDDLRLAGVSPDAVSEADPALAELYRQYVAALDASRLADRAEVLAAGTREIGRRPRRPVGLPLVVLDVSLRDRASRRFAAALAAASPHVLWTIPAGDGATEAAVRQQSAQPFAAPDEGRAGNKKSPGAPAADAVLSAQRHLFGTRAPDGATGRGGLTVISAPGAAAEAVEHARVMLEAAREVPFDRMAVLLPDPAGQASAFREAFDRAEIPAFFEAGTRRQHPAGRAFLVLLDCALDRLSATRFAEYLSLGETPAPALADSAAADVDVRHPNAASESSGKAPGAAGNRAAGNGAAKTDAKEDDDAPAAYVAPRRWERLILDSEVIGGLDRWERRLARFGERLRRDEEIERDGPKREAIAFRRRDLERLTVTALPILRRLGALPREARFSVWVEHLEALARAALLHPEGVLECLAETAPMGEVEDFSLREVRDSLARRLAAVVHRSHGDRYGRVWVGPIGAAHGLAFEVVAVPGLTERAFPRVIREDPMLLDRVRAKLSPELPVRADHTERERLRLRVAVGAASRRLVLSFSSLNPVEGRRQVPSYYLAEVFRAGLGRIPTLSEIKDKAASEDRIVRGIRAPKNPADAVDRREFDMARVAVVLDETRAPPGRAASLDFLLRDPALTRSLRQEFMRQSRKWQSPDGFLNPGPETLALLERHRPANKSFSATGLEAYAACPYQFFLKNLVRLRPLERPEALVHLDPLTRGSLLHDVFFHLGQELRARNLVPLAEDDLEEAYGILREAFWRMEEETRERVAPAFPGIWKDQMDGLLGDLRGFLQRYAGSGRTPLANEFTFGMAARQLADPASPEEAAVLPGGLRLHGSVDAVERLPNGQTQITDFKTGKASVEPTGGRDALFGGRTLQPMAYALAYEALAGVPVDSGRLYYATIRGAYQETVVESSDAAARATFEGFVAALDGAIRQGRFPALPNPKARYPVCQYCDYLPVCGPRPATHARSKLPAGHAGALDEVSVVRDLP